MTETLAPDVCIVGAGSAGLVAAAGAAQLGLSVVLIERAEMGGDCLNYGCVPSKALIAAAKAAQAQRDGAPFGIAPVEPKVDFGCVMDHVHQVIEAIAPNDSVERFEKLGFGEGLVVGFAGFRTGAGTRPVRLPAGELVSRSLPGMAHESVSDRQTQPRRPTDLGRDKRPRCDRPHFARPVRAAALKRRRRGRV